MVTQASLEAASCQRSTRDTSQSSGTHRAIATGMSSIARKRASAQCRSSSLARRPASLATATAGRRKRRRRRDEVCEFQSFTPSASATVNTSLSPRPQRFMMITPSLPISRATSPTRASACDGSSAGRMPSSLRAQLKRSQRLVVGGAEVLRAADVVQIRMFRADAGVIEARADRVAFEDLAVLVLQAGKCGCRAARPGRPPLIAALCSKRSSMPRPAASTPIRLHASRRR